METTILGETGVQVSKICLGCMSYGSSAWRPWVLDEEAAKPFFRRAVEAGSYRPNCFWHIKHPQLQAHQNPEDISGL